MRDRELIDAAIAQGKLTVVPAGVTSRQPKQPVVSGMARVRPETCGSGNQTLRHQFLDEIDGDWS